MRPLKIVYLGTNKMSYTLCCPIVAMLVIMPVYILSSPAYRPVPKTPPTHLLWPPSWTLTTGFASANGPVSAPRAPPCVHPGSAFWRTDVTAANTVPGRWARPVMREIYVTIIKDFTVTTALTSRGTKKEYVPVSDPKHSSSFQLDSYQYL